MRQRVGGWGVGAKSNLGGIRSTFGSPFHQRLRRLQRKMTTGSLSFLAHILTDNTSLAGGGGGGGCKEVLMVTISSGFFRQGEDLSNLSNLDLRHLYFLRI